MSNRHCTYCDKRTPVVHLILKIPLCQKCHKLPEFELISRTKATKDYGLTSELDALRSCSVPNPVFTSRPPATMYLLKDVKAVATSGAGQQRLAQRTKRSESAKRAAARRRDDLIQKTLATNFSIPEMPWDDLIERACRHYNSRKVNATSIRPDADEGTLHRIMVNYLRHECTQYDEHCASLMGQTGKEDAYPAVKELVLEAIAEKYPELIAECYRQISELWK